MNEEIEAQRSLLAHLKATQVKAADPKLEFSDTSSLKYNRKLDRTSGQVFFLSLHIVLECVPLYSGLLFGLSFMDKGGFKSGWEQYLVKVTSLMAGGIRANIILACQFWGPGFTFYTTDKTLG